MSKKRKWELRHDMLAPKIWAKLPEQDRVLRQIQRSLAQRQVDYAEGKGSLLGEKELEAWRIYRAKLAEMTDIRQEVLAFFDESEKALIQSRAEEKRKQKEEIEKERRLRGEAQAAKETAEQSQQLAEDNAKIATANAKRAKQRTRLALLISMIALVLAGFAGWSNNQAKKDRDKAETAEQKANESAELAADKTKEAEGSLARAEAEEKNAREALAQLGEEQQATKKAKQRAEENALLATKSADDARLALANLQQSNATVVQLILDNARKDVMNLDYDNALLKIKAADGLGALKDSVALAYLEIAFWHNEAGHRDRTVDILDSADVFVNNSQIHSALKNIPADTIAARVALRETLKTFYPTAFEQYWARYYPVMVELHGGTFMMGCDSIALEKAYGESKQSPENEALHQATVSDFSIAETETTFWQFGLYCAAVGKNIKDYRPNWLPSGDHPVVNVSWYDAIQYSNWVSKQQEIDTVYSGDLSSRGVKVDWTKKGFRLPTEAEWEYAAGAGNQTVFAGTSSPDSLYLFANIGGDKDGYEYTSPAKTYSPNKRQLYDMSGNVWEWCWDWYGNYPENSPTDFAGPDAGSSRVLRGGSWLYYDYIARVANRNYDNPVYRYYGNGFRLSRAR